MAKYLLFPLFFVSLIANSQQLNENAQNLYKLGIKEMDKGEIANSIKYFEQARTIDSSNIYYPYEIAHANYLIRQYKKTIKLLEPLMTKRGVTDHFYHLLGSSYEHSGSEKQAIKIYNEGLEKFPGSGIINYALGNLSLKKKDYHSALQYFESGIKAEPGFAENYYWASKVHASLKDKLWGLMYAELYVNMEGINSKSIELEKMIFDVYQKGIVKNGDTVMVEIADEDSTGRNFELDYENYLSKSANSINKAISINSLYEIRKDFLENWILTAQNDLYPNTLLDFQEKVYLKGYFEPYTYWLLKEGSPEEFENYIATHEQQYDEFISWLSQNYLVPTKSNYFLESEYSGLNQIN